MTTRKTTKTPPPTDDASASFDLGQVASQFDARYTEGDAARARGLSRIAMVNTARANMLRRQRAEASDAGKADVAKDLDATITATEHDASVLTAAAVVATKPVPVPKADETIVHGLIHNAKSGLEVSLVDDKGHTTATGKVSADGHFLLRAPTGKVSLRVHDDHHPAPIEVHPDAKRIAFVVVRSRG